PGKPTVADPVTATATLVLVLSPLKGATGQLRVHRAALPAGQTVAAVLPAPGTYQRVVWNGAVLSADAQARTRLQPGDEVWAFPTWGDPVTSGVIGGLLIQAAIGIAVSVAVTALTYVLFPPAKPHMNAPEEHTFSFEGIRTATG